MLSRKNKFPKLPWPVLVCLVALLLVAGRPPAPQNQSTESPRIVAVPPRPNILVILTDDQGYGDVTAFGAPDLQTPHLDGLVKAGMKLTNFHANSSVCSPTRASLLSGRYPEAVGVPGVIRTNRANNWGHLSSAAVLMPDRLRKAGYTTALIGKWHLGLTSPNTPNERGFDFFHGFAGDMMEDYTTHIRDGKNYMRLNGQEINPQGHATDLFTQWSVEYIRKRAKAAKPFFLYLAYNAPHVPIQPPIEWVQKVKVRQPGISEKRAQLVALIEHMDDGIGKVIGALKDSGLNENTMILFTSDKGGHLSAGEINVAVNGAKGSMYEGGLKVPACVVWPGRIAPDSQSDQLLLTIDIYPTVLAAIGAKAEDQVDGVSFLPTLLGQKATPAERTVFFTRREGEGGYGGKTIDAVRKGDWKLLQNFPDQPYELYNLREDPLEQHNLAREQPEVYKELFSLLQNHRSESGLVPWQRP